MSKENRHLSEIRVRRQLERAIGSRFHETTWSDFVADKYVEEYLEGREDMRWKQLRRAAEGVLVRQHAHERELREKWRSSEQSEEDHGSEQGRGRRHTKTSGPIFDVELPQREQKRVAVLLEIQMRRAAEHPEVVRFRREHLAGRLLSADDAETYFSPEPRGEITDRALAAIGRRLGRDYGWHRDDAAWFVLTGEPPTLRPLAVDVFMNESVYGPSYCKLTLHVAPWIPPGEVEKAFAQIRDQVRCGLGPGTVGEQRLEVLRFVEEERAKSGRRPSFEALRQIWNQKHPYWAYADYRVLSKAYREAHQEVVHPEYLSPRRTKTPNIERQEARNLEWHAAVREREANRERATGETSGRRASPR